jgi:hypothetical protein
MGKEILSGAVLDLHQKAGEAPRDSLAATMASLGETALRVKDERDGAVGLLRRVLITGDTWREQAALCAQVEAFLATLNKPQPRLTAAARFERQQQLEQALAAFHPDTVEALALLHAAGEPDAGARRRRADPRMDVAKVKELFAMHKEMMDREARGLQRRDGARAGEHPADREDRRNDHTKSMYATLAAINDEITPIYTAEGLSVSFDTYSPERDKDLPPLDAGKVRVIASARTGRHSRKYHLDGALDDAGKDGTKNKTGIQAMGSTVSYLRRYLVCMIFNVATADDNDGNGGGRRRQPHGREGARQAPRPDQRLERPRPTC